MGAGNWEVVSVIRGWCGETGEGTEVGWSLGGKEGDRKV